nr:hypothetical protein [Streptomyces sp. PR69]
MVRWAAFSCLLVPVVLVVYGSSVGGAAATALGLAAITTACRVVLRHSERAAARTASRAARPPVAGAPGESAPRAHRSGRHGATRPRRPLSHPPEG